MKKITLIIITVIFVSFNITQVTAQPYYYFHYRQKTEADTVKLRPAFWDFNKKVISYLTIPSEIELSNNNFALDLRWDPKQKWLTCHYPFELFDLQNQAKVMDLPWGEEYTIINEIVFSSVQNKLFINYEFNSRYSSFREKFMYIIDPTTKKVLAKINKTSSEIGHENEPMFLSRDENTLYYYVEDTLAYHQNEKYNSDSLCFFSTITNSIIKKEPISKYGLPNASNYRIVNGHNGKGVVISAVENSTPGKRDVYYRVFDFDTNTGSKFVKIELSKTANEYFTSDGQYLVFSTEQEYNHGVYASDGTFYIYGMDAECIIKTVTLPQQGQAFSFQNYPDRLFYFLFNYQTQQGSSYTIDVDSLVQEQAGAKVKLINSSGSKLTGGALQYYENGWKDAVNNNDGTFSVPTTLKTLSLKMNYAYGSQQKSNVTVGGDTIVFQTINAQVKLLDSKEAILDTGRVQYYSNGWRDFGATTNGVAVKELLPNNYSFRMTHEFVSIDKAQNTETNNVVVFNTVLCNVNVLDAQNQPVNNAVVSYYSGAWRSFGTTLNGTVTKELLPVNLSFRAVSGTKQLDKTQNIGTNNNVEIKLP